MNATNAQDRVNYFSERLQKSGSGDEASYWQKMLLQEMSKQAFPPEVGGGWSRSSFATAWVQESQKARPAAPKPNLLLLEEECMR